MIVKPKAQAQGKVVKDGTYKATVKEVKSFTNAFGERLGVVFQLDGGEYDGVELMRSCSPELTAKGKLAELIKGVIGRDITQEEYLKGFDLDALTGVSCQVLVLQSRGKNGNLYSNVERVFSN